MGFQVAGLADYLKITAISNTDVSKTQLEHSELSPLSGKLGQVKLASFGLYMGCKLGS